MWDHLSSDSSGSYNTGRPVHVNEAGCINASLSKYGKPKNDEKVKFKNFAVS